MKIRITIGLILIWILGVSGGYYCGLEKKPTPQLSKLKVDSVYLFCEYRQRTFLEVVQGKKLNPFDDDNKEEFCYKVISIEDGWVLIDKSWPNKERITSIEEERLLQYNVAGGCEYAD